MAETERLLPNRPNPDTSKIPASDKDMLSYAIAFAIPNQKAFALWHPEFLDSSGKLNKTGRAACTQFFNYSKNREYADSYTAYLKEFLNVDKGKGETHLIEVDESRKDKALKSLLNQAMSMVESGDTLDPDTLKVLTEIFKKLGILKDEVEQEIRPVRFLPERCFSGCRYRLFVENAVKGGAVIDECQFCKALAYATENGYKDDATKRLDIPKEVLDVEPENTIKTLDILSGKVEN